VLVDRLGHLKHIQLLAAKNRLQLVIGDDFALILRILEFVLLDVRPYLFRNLAARKWSVPTILASCSDGCMGFMNALFVFALTADFSLAAGFAMLCIS
jgi:hypothetical protein